MKWDMSDGVFGRIGQTVALSDLLNPLCQSRVLNRVTHRTKIDHLCRSKAVSGALRFN